MPLPVPPPSTLARPLVSVAQAVWPYARRLYQERQAGQMPLGGRNDLLDRSFDQTIARLRAGDVDDGWWRDLLNVVEHRYVTPKFLRIPALREWLARAEVQADIKALARRRVMGDDADDQVTEARLSRAYAESTGENERLADGPITVVIAVVAAGHLGSIDRPQRPIAGMIQAGANENRAAFRQILDRIGPDAVVVRAHSECAEHELSLILKRRSFELDSGRDKINGLAHRIRNEDLCHADKAVRAKVLNWAARLHANQVETLPDAKQYREMLLEVDPNADTRIIDAMIWEMEADADGALRVLRDIDDPDARTVMSVILYRSRSQEDMWAWFDEHPERDDPNFLTGVGWRNIALWLAQGGRWTEAATYLVNAHEHLDQCPDLIFVEGVISAAMLLPEEYRQYALEMNLFHPIIDTIEGLEADQIRERADGCFAHATHLMTELGENRRAQAARDWRLWLRLTDPRPEIVEAARREVQEGMRDGSRAVDLLDFARAFGIAFDDGPISRHLEHRKRFGDLHRYGLKELASDFDDLSS